MPRTKGRKKRPKINTTNDYVSQLAEKQETIASLNTEITSIQKAIEEQKNTLNEKKTALKKAEKEAASPWKRKKAKADAKAAEEAKKTEAEAVLKYLLASGMSADGILEKLK